MSAEIKPKKYGQLKIESHFLKASQIFPKNSAEGSMWDRQLTTENVHKNVTKLCQQCCNTAEHACDYSHNCHHLPQSPISPCCCCCSDQIAFLCIGYNSVSFSAWIIYLYFRSSLGLLKSAALITAIVYTKHALNIKRLRENTAWMFKDSMLCWYLRVIVHIDCY